MQQNEQPVIVKEVSNIRKTDMEFKKDTNLFSGLQGLLNSLLKVIITANYTKILRQKPQHNLDYSLSQVCFSNKIYFTKGFEAALL